MLAGPGRTKHDLEKYLDGHGEDLRGKLVAVEDVEQATPQALANAARQLFAARRRAMATELRAARR